MRDKEHKDKLPGNHGQFGVGDATESYKPLEDHPTPTPPPPDADPAGTDPGDRP